MSADTPRYRRTRLADMWRDPPPGWEKEGLWRVNCLLPGGALSATVGEMTRMAKAHSIPIEPDQIPVVLGKLIALGWAEEVTTHG